MVDFRPFKGLVPSLKSDELIENRVAPPYDVIEEAEKREFQSRPGNITRITLGARAGNYSKASAEFNKLIETGALTEDGEESFYIYRQTFSENGRKLTRTGIVGRLRVEPYGASILPHEETSPKVKEDRLNLLRALNVHPESIFCIFEKADPGVMKKLSGAKALFDFTDGTGVRHEFARITSPSLVRSIFVMLSGQRLLIADGHHRYETALKYSQDNPDDDAKAFVLATLVAGNDPGMVIRPTHRLYEVGGFSTGFFLSLASKEFGLWEATSLEELQQFMQKSKRTSLGFLLKDGRMFAGETLTNKSDDPLESLDAKICQDSVYTKMLVPLAEKGEVRIEYDHDLASVSKKMSTGEWDVAVILSPPRLETIWAVASLGKKMPRKSTFFWPKIWSGFVLYPMR